MYTRWICSVLEDSGKSDSDDSSAAEDDEGMDVGEDDEAGLIKPFN